MREKEKRDAFECVQFEWVMLELAALKAIGAIEAGE